VDIPSTEFFFTSEENFKKFGQTSFANVSKLQLLTQNYLAASCSAKYRISTKSIQKYGNYEKNFLYALK
jgi:hypothetical protein